MALSNKAKSSLLDLIFNTAKVAVKAKANSRPAQQEPNQAPVKPVAQNQNLAGCCDKKKVK